MIPVVDCENDIRSHGIEIFDAIEKIGFVYLTNFGIEADTINKIFAGGDKFFSLPTEVKAKYARKSAPGSGNSGYVAPGVETINPASVAELREAFNIAPFDKGQIGWPDAEMPEFRPFALQFFAMCQMVALEVCKIIGERLPFVQDADFFPSRHTGKTAAGNSTTMRLLHYPPLPDHLEGAAIRCGEHSDYGTLTLLFQDSAGGLQVRDTSGQFVAAQPLENAVLVNTGDLLQRWTADRIMAVKHRVLAPEDAETRKLERRSLAFFLHPDADCLVQPLDGSTKYKPITDKQYLQERFRQTY